MATFQILKAECKECAHEYMFLGLCVCAECWAWSADYQSLKSLCLLTETVCLEIFIKFTVIQVWKYNVSLFFFSRTLFLEVGFLGKRSLVNSNFSDMSVAVLFLPPGDKNETELSHVSF